VQRDSYSLPVITGGASGLGEATARLLASKGVRVAICDLNGARENDLATELGGVFCEVNVTSDDSVDAGFAKARAAIGQERILINCVGIGGTVKTAFRDKKTGAIGHFPLKDFQRIVDVNLVGTVRC
jgi:NAD(P)-dependent dehydrogenase (short-subunit alcohol dehydrogenase family)